MEWKEMNKSMNANGMESINAAPRAPTARGKPTTQQFSFFAGWRSEAKQRMDELVELADGLGCLLVVGYGLVGQPMLRNKKDKHSQAPPPFN